MDEILDVIRLQAEECECHHGYHILQSLGGGTGSGLGSLILEKIGEECPDKIRSTFSVYPSPKVSDEVVEVYNTILTINRLIKYLIEMLRNIS